MKVIFQNWLFIFFIILPLCCATREFSRHYNFNDDNNSNKNNDDDDVDNWKKTDNIQIEKLIKECPVIIKALGARIFNDVNDIIINSKFQTNLNVVNDDNNNSNNNNNNSNSNNNKNNNYEINMKNIKNLNFEKSTTTIIKTDTIKSKKQIVPQNKILITLQPQTIYKGTSTLKLITSKHRKKEPDNDSDEEYYGYNGQLNATLKSTNFLDMKILGLLPIQLIVFGTLDKSNNHDGTSNDDSSLGGVDGGGGGNVGSSSGISISDSISINHADDEDDVLKIVPGGLHKWSKQLENNIWKYLGWDDWSDFTSCSIACGKGVQQRFRKCILDNPNRSNNNNDNNNDYDNDGNGNGGGSSSSSSSSNIFARYTYNDNDEMISSGLDSTTKNSNNMNNNNDNDNYKNTNNDDDSGNSDSNRNNHVSSSLHSYLTGYRNSNAHQLHDRQYSHHRNHNNNHQHQQHHHHHHYSQYNKKNRTSLKRGKKRRKKKGHDTIFKEEKLSTLSCEGYNIEQRDCNFFDCDDDIIDLLKFYKKSSFSSNDTTGYINSPISSSSSSTPSSLSSSFLEMNTVENSTTLIINPVTVTSSSSSSSSWSATTTATTSTTVAANTSNRNSRNSNVSHKQNWKDPLNFTIMMTLKTKLNSTQSTIFSLRNFSTNFYMEQNQYGLKLYQERDDLSEMLPIKLNLFDNRWHQIAISIRNGDFISVYADCVWINSFVVSKHLLILPDGADIEVGRGFNGDLQQLLIIPGIHDKQQCSSDRISINEVKRYIIDTFIDDNRQQQQQQQQQQQKEHQQDQENLQQGEELDIDSEDDD